MVFIQSQMWEWLGVLAIGYIGVAVWVNWVGGGRAGMAQILVEGMKSEERILEVIRVRGKAQRGDLISVTGLPRTSLGRVLDEIEKAGKIRQVGDRKAAFYVAVE